MPQIESMVLPPRLPLVVTTANRGRTFTKDSRLVNCYLETNKQGELWVYKRPGILTAFTFPAAQGRGINYWRGDVYFIFAGDLYKNGVLVATGLEQTGGTYRFSATLGASPKMVLGNGKKTYTYGEITARIATINATTASGTLPAGDYFYVVTATFTVPPGETTRSNEASASISSPGTITITWDPVLGATGYRVYRGTAANLENEFVAVGAGVFTLVDDGTVVYAAGTPSVTPVDALSDDLHTIDEDFPIETVKGIVYLDGATYVMNREGEIWGSVINSVDQPGDWSALNFIAAQSEPDFGVYLAKQFVYVIAMGEWSTEVFFNAGNPTGSPLGRVDGSKLSFGCASAESVQEIDDRLFWISSTKSAAVQVSSLDQLNHQIVSTDPIDRLLQSSNLLDVASFQLKIDGHSFYLITLRDINLTLAYDINEDEWQQWTDTNGNYFKMMYYTYDSAKRHLFQHETDGKIYYVSPAYKNDDAVLITVDIYAPVFDAQTKRRKIMTRMDFVGDQEPGSILQVRATDDDYQTWNDFRLVDLSHSDPMLINEGTFTKRAYHFRHKCNTALRMQAVDVQYDLGTL